MTAQWCRHGLLLVLGVIVGLVWYADTPDPSADGERAAELAPPNPRWLGSRVFPAALRAERAVAAPVVFASAAAEAPPARADASAPVERGAEFWGGGSTRKPTSRWIIGAAYASQQLSLEEQISRELEVCRRRRFHMVSLDGEVDYSGCESEAIQIVVMDYRLDGVPALAEAGELPLLGSRMDDICRELAELRAALHRFADLVELQEGASRPPSPLGVPDVVRMTDAIRSVAKFCGS